MAGRIPQQFIDDLLNRIDIVDIIDSRVPLRKAGRDFKACCPFHEEKTPSFTVSQTKQFYHCFGCGAHGTAISFLMEYDHMDFIEALKDLAHKAGVQLPESQQTQPLTSQNPDLHELMQRAATFFRQQLSKHPSSPSAREYLKTRGLTGDIAKEFCIGYAPPGWDNLLKAINTSKLTENALVTTGMVVRKDNNSCYDRFRNRIMFPIRDRRGRVIAFGGRVIDKNDNPKYLNSPESPLFHKGKELYGLYEARQAERKLDRLLIVEGYMDVVALAQFGIRYAVATLGTALTPDHISPLFRTAPEAIFCFDGDRAGRDAAWKALDIMLPELNDNRSARFMFLPEGEDPDTLIRRIGRGEFELAIQKATPLSNFLIEHLLQDIDMSAIDARERLVEKMQPKIRKIPNLLARRRVITSLAERISMDNIELMTALGEKALEKPSKQAFKPKAGGTNLSPIRTAVTILLNQPQLAHTIDNSQRFLSIEEPGIRLLVDLLEFIHSTPNATCGSILEHWRNRPEGRHLGKLASRTITTPQEGLEPEFKGALALLDKQRIEQEYKKILHKAQTTPLTTDEKRRITELQQEKRALTQPTNIR